MRGWSRSARRSTLRAPSSPRSAARIGAADVKMKRALPVAARICFASVERGCRAIEVAFADQDVRDVVERQGEQRQRALLARPRDLFEAERSKAVDVPEQERRGRSESPASTGRPCPEARLGSIAPRVATPARPRPARRRRLSRARPAASPAELDRAAAAICSPRERSFARRSRKQGHPPCPPRLSLGGTRAGPSPGRATRDAVPPRRRALGAARMSPPHAA